MLNCYWPKHLIGSKEVEDNGFNMGVFLMATGMEEISDKTIDELKFRAELLFRLHGEQFYRDVDLELWKGLSINARNESRRTWLARKKQGILQSRLYGKPAHEQAAVKKIATARFNRVCALAEVHVLGAVAEDEVLA